MRISDWSSDVCSSDLSRAEAQRAGVSFGGDVPRLRPLLAPIEDDMHRSAVDTDHLEFGGDRRGAVGRNFQQAVAQIEMPRQDARRDRQRVDAGVEHADTAGLPSPLLARLPPADILFPDNTDPADKLGRA